MMIHHKFAFGRKSYCDELYFRITFYYRGEGFLGEYQKVRDSVKSRFLALFDTNICFIISATRLASFFSRRA